MVERERETIVTTDGGGRGGGTLIAVVLLIILLVVLYLLYTNGVFGGAEEVKIDADVNLPATGGGSSK